MPKNKVFLSKGERKVEMLKAVDELDKTPSWLYFLFAFLFLILFGLIIFYEI